MIKSVRCVHDCKLCLTVAIRVEVTRIKLLYFNSSILPSFVP